MNSLILRILCAYVCLATYAYADILTFDELVTGATSYEYHADGDGVADVVFSTADPYGFRTLGPGLNMNYIEEPGLEGSTTINPDLRVDFLSGAVGSLRFGFALNDYATQNTWTSFSVYDVDGNLLASDFEYGRYTQTGYDTSSFPEGIIDVSFHGNAAYAEFDFNAGGQRFIIDNFEGTFGTVTLPPTLMGPKNKELISINAIDQNRPTVVLTHGLSPESAKDEAPDTLWTGTLDKQAGKLISENGGDGLNIIHYIWEDGFQVGFTGSPSENSYNAAEAYVADAGANLARELLKPENLGPHYSKKIHFIGHSLGTVVNAYAARLFLENASEVTEAQFTALDRPDKVKTNIPGCLLFPGCKGYGENFFAEIFQDLQRNKERDLTLWIDNYYASHGAGVGDKTKGINVYNHVELINPNDLDDSIFDNEGVDNNHSGVQQWYRWTMAPNELDDLFEVCHSDTGKLLNLNPFFDESLNPCNLGWKWSIVRQNPRPFPVTKNLPVRTTTQLLALNDYEDFGCELTSSSIESSLIVCVEASSPFGIADVTIPENSASLSFEYQFLDIGDGDYVAVYLDNILIWSLAGTSYPGDGFVDSGPIPINDLSGPRVFKVALYGVNEANADFEIRNIRTTQINSNQAPIAEAGIAQELECSSSEGAEIVLSGTSSYDPDGDALTYVWTGPFGEQFGEGVSVTLPLGKNTITLTVYDEYGNQDSDTVEITVRDTLAPSVELSVSPNVLWPPNHKMAPIQAMVIATDVCDASPSIILETITSSESDTTNTYDPIVDSTVASGNTAGDIIVDSSGNISLRAERSGTGKGRIYTINYSATDASGNTAISGVKVTVPHNR